MTLNTSRHRQRTTVGPGRSLPRLLGGPVVQRQRRGVVSHAYAQAETKTRSGRSSASSSNGSWDDTEGGEDFYSLLGVSPDASRSTIKRAYLSIMKECHPDRTNEEANEFCALLNEIYETLTDPSRRAAYDALVGFSDLSVNPFVDTAAEKDQVFVDEMSCIGCRMCQSICPKTFIIEEEFGRARVVRQGEEPPDKQQEAIDSCPVSCIHWVSAPQLSHLEAAMARMSRVAVWSMGTSGAGSNADVFTEAAMAWQKRFLEMQARRARWAAAKEQQSGMGAGLGGLWSNVVTFTGAAGGSFQSQAYEQANRARSRQYGGDSTDGEFSGGEENIPVGDKEAKGIARLAARAARASRTWKVVQEVARARKATSVYLPEQSTASVSISSSDEM